MPDPLHGPQTLQNRSAHARLDSWKEIADYLGKAERTVKRWETERSLPVHRLPGGGHASIYAFTSELDAWLLSETPKGALASHEPPEVANESPHARNDRASSPVRPSLRTTSSTSWRMMAFALALVVFVLAAAYFLNLRTTSAYTTSRLHSLFHRNASTSSAASSDPEKKLARDLYLRGRFEWDKRTPESLNRALDYFTQSIIHNPSDAQVYVGLADTYLLLREYALMPENEAYDRAITADRKAIEIDDSLPEAHRSLAFALVFGKWDFVAGQKEFQRAIELNPRDPLAHLWYANSFAAPDWFPVCLHEIDRAQELDPASHVILADKGLLLFHAGQTRQGLDLVKQAELASPQFLSPHRYLASMYFTLREYPGFLSESDIAADLSHDDVLKATTAAARTGFQRDGELGLFHELYLSQKKFHAEGKLPGTYLARTCVRMGKREEALRLLREDYDRHEPAFLLIRENLDLLTLKDEPEYQALLREVNPPAPAVLSSSPSGNSANSSPNLPAADSR